MVLSAWGCGALRHLPQMVRHAMQRWESAVRFRSSPRRPNYLTTARSWSIGRCDVYELIIEPDKPVESFMGPRPSRGGTVAKPHSTPRTSCRRL